MSDSAYFSLLCFLGLSAMAGGQTAGPLVGQTSDTGARFLYRTNAEAASLRVSVLSPNGTVVATSDAKAEATNDYVAKFSVTGLTPNTTYTYRVEQVSGGSAQPIAASDADQRFRTFPQEGQRTTFTAAFASCANATSEPVWQRIGSLNPNALFLMGDTPYIDTSDLAAVREKHRNFLRTENLAKLIARTPTVGAWDDHDFGKNNGNGINVPLKANNLRGFTEYRANNQFGTGTEGNYNKARCGPMEVFVLDHRWFSQTAPSPVDPTQPTCLGTVQWQWLLDALEKSTAPFKVLAFGAIWQDKKNSENDDMFTYWYERDALFDFIRAKKIPGVVLLGGDIHVSRYLLHAQRFGYDAHDFVTSPAHTSVIPSLDVYNPDLEWSSKSDRQFMTLTADTRVQPATLVAKMMKHDGSVLREVTMTYDQLVPKSGSGLGEGLRGYWPLDQDLENHSALGARIHATAVGGATAGNSDSIRGGAARFQRNQSQYLVVPRSVLPENSARHTVSLWAKPASLPAHGSSDQSYLIESTPVNGTGTAGGFGISLGLEAASASDKVALSLYTHTIKAAAASPTGVTAPTAISQGPFNVPIDRAALLNRWTQISFTFDSSQLRLFVNGQLAATFPLAEKGPLSENGGLVIGGHRAGTGRNFDGAIDEVAIWSRVLADAEMASLWNNGSPALIPSTTAEIDTDGDTLPDWWERDAGLNPADPADAAKDADGDKIPAFIEFAMGTSPRFNDSGFYQYLRNLVANPGTADLAFKDPASQQAGMKLTLESSTDMTTWTPVPLTADGVKVIDSLLRLTVPPDGADRKFFRFRALPSNP